MSSLPIQLRLCVMFRPPAPGLELQNGDHVIRSADQTVDGAAYDAVATHKRDVSNKELKKALSQMAPAEA